MRLWHYKLIPYLPKSQLLAQKRECDLIWRDYKQGKQTNHILINYIHKYKVDYLMTYYCELTHEFVNRGYKFKDNAPLLQEFNVCGHFKEHDKDYLTICYYNLLEKCMRGQKDFTLDVWVKLNDFYKKEMQK